jgi:hypothetical protein
VPSFQIEATFYLNQSWMDFQTNLNSIQLKFHAMSFNIFIQMKLNFHQINSFISLLDQFIITGSVLQHGAQVQVNKLKLTMVCLLSTF